MGKLEAQRVKLTQSVGLGRTGPRAGMRASAVGGQARLDEGGSGVPGHGPAHGSRSSVHTLQLVKQCERGAHKMERTEQVLACTHSWTSARSR